MAGVATKMLDSKKRVLAVDALRGAAMLCIVGADSIALALKEMAGNSELTIAFAARFVGSQFSHAHWDGFHFYDLIFPLFLFTVGLSIPLSLAKARTHGRRDQALMRILRRSAVLFLLGIAYNADLTQPWTEVRLVGVLQRIAICYLVAATLYLYAPSRAVWYVTVGLVVSYALVLELLPSGQSGPYDPAMNLAIWVDAHWLPGKRHFGSWDPEGLLTTAPAITSCLIGVITGRTLTEGETKPATRSHMFIGAGIILLAVSYVVSLQIPIIKNLWTASYIIIAGGWSLVLFGLTYRLMDVAGQIRWASACIWIGTNAILVYVLDGFIEFDRLILRLMGNETVAFLDRLTLPGTSRLMASIAGLGVMVAVARALYVRGLFLRL